MNDRDRDYTKFTFDSYRRFKKVLGEFDAVLECTELAIREFNSIYSKAESKSEFIDKMSSKHSVNVNVHDYRKMELRVSTLYIVSVHREFEIFLQEFKDEFQNYHKETWIRKSDGETILDNIIANVSNICGLNFIDEQVLRICNYYRLLRNRMAHGNKDIKAIKKLYEQVSLYKVKITDKFNLEKGLNDFENLCYDDFVLFTNIVKYIAFDLSYNGKPSIDYISSEIAKKHSKSLNKVKDREERFTNVLRNIYITHYGRISTVDFEILHKNVKSLLA